MVKGNISYRLVERAIEGGGDLFQRAAFGSISRTGPGNSPALRLSHTRTDRCTSSETFPRELVVAHEETTGPR